MEFSSSRYSSRRGTFFPDAKFSTCQFFLTLLTYIRIAKILETLFALIYFHRDLNASENRRLFSRVY